MHMGLKGVATPYRCVYVYTIKLCGAFQFAVGGFRVAQKFRGDREKCRLVGPNRS